MHIYKICEFLRFFEALVKIFIGSKQPVIWLFRFLRSNIYYNFLIIWCMLYPIFLVENKWSKMSL